MTNVVYLFAAVMALAAPCLWAGITLLACDRKAAGLANLPPRSRAECLALGIAWYVVCVPSVAVATLATTMSFDLWNVAPQFNFGRAGGLTAFLVLCWLVSTSVLLPGLARLRHGLSTPRFLAMVLVAGAVAAVGAIASLWAAFRLLDSVGYLVL